MKRLTVEEKVFIIAFILISAVATGYFLNLLSGESTRTKCHRELVRHLGAGTDAVLIPDGWKPFDRGGELWFERKVCE